MTTKQLPTTLPEAIQLVLAGKADPLDALHALDKSLLGNEGELGALFDLLDAERGIEVEAAPDAGSWIDAELAARVAGVHAGTIRRWAASGKVKSRREGRGPTARVLVERRSLFALLPS